MKKWLLLFTKLVSVVIFILITTEFGIYLIQVAWKPAYQLFFDDPEKIFIYSLGESTTLGVPYEEKISPAQLISYSFNDTIDHKKTEFIFLAKSGKTIEYNYFKFYFELLLRPHKNGLVIIYSGINESINNVPLKNSEAWKTIQRSIVLSKLAFILDLFRNSPERFAYRYHETIELAKQNKYKVVLSQLVGNYADISPILFAQDNLLNNENASLLWAARKNYADRNFTEAEKKFTSLGVGESSNHPYLLYFIGRCMYERNALDSAKIYLEKVPEIDMTSGFAKWKNGIIEKAAIEQNVFIAKTFDRFVESSNNKLLGFNLIGDLHHPILKGYCIMANEMSSCVSRIYNQNIVRKLTPAAVEQHFGLDGEFYEGVYYRRVEWFIFESFMTEDKQQFLEGAKKNLAEYTKLNSSNHIAFLWQVIIGALEKNKHDFVKNLSLLQSSSYYKELIGHLAAALNEHNIMQLETNAMSLTLSNNEKIATQKFINDLKHEK